MKDKTMKNIFSSISASGLVQIAIVSTLMVVKMETLPLLQPLYLLYPRKWQQLTIKVNPKLT